MSFIACLNRVFGRKGGEVKANGVDVAKTNDANPPKTYKVPDGLKPRILELLDKADIAGSRRQAHEALWYLLSERCPETKVGNWRFSSQGKDLFLVENVKPKPDQGNCA